MNTFQRLMHWRRPALAVGLMVVLGVAVSGCSSSHYRKSADREVYGTIQSVESQIFGRTNAFSIETPYSARVPGEILAAELIEDRLLTNARTLKIEEALGLAVSRARRYQGEKERLYLAALTLTGERYAFGPQFSGSVGASMNRAADGSRYVTADGQVGVERLLRTGGRLGVSLANDLLRYYTGDPRRSVVSTLSVNLVQPLLRGFGRNDAAVESLTQAERNLVYAVRNYAFFQHSFALEILEDYFALLVLQDNIRNRYSDYLARVQSTKRLEARRDRERLDDVDRARQSELASRNNYVNGVASYRNALDAFKIKLGLLPGDRVVLDDAALKAVRAAGLLPLAFDPVGAYRVAVERQLPMLNAIDRFEDSKRKVRVSADRLRPGLTLVADASLESDRPVDYTRFDPGEVRAGMGIELDLPLDRLRERNNYRATLISFESELRNLTLTLDTLRDGIQRGLRTLEQRRQNYEIQQTALELANRRVRGTTLSVEAGRAETRDLIEAQDDQLASQNAVTAALIDYQQARLQLLLDLGVLDTNQPEFWLKEVSAGVLPGPGPAVQLAVPATSEPVRPPEELLAE